MIITYVSEVRRINAKFEQIKDGIYFLKAQRYYKIITVYVLFIPIFKIKKDINA